MSSKTENYKLTFIDPGQADAVNTALLDWFAGEKRDLPFRKQHDPYKIWISEIMAQQTRMETLIPYYQRFVSAFPDVQSLAQAAEDDVLKAWEGLGYYSRARNLQKAAREIAALGAFPAHYTDLVKLPGIGPYTAGAIASIAFNEKVPAVDGNVLRVMSRIYGSERDIADLKTRKLLTEELSETMPDQAGDYNESLMELGALVCIPKSPKCMICPVQAYCTAFESGRTAVLPVKAPKKKPRIIRQQAFIIESGGGTAGIKAEPHIMLEKRPADVLLSGLYGLPLVADDDPDREKQIQSLTKGQAVTVLGNSRHVFTHIIWETQVCLVRPEPDDPAVSKQQVAENNQETAYTAGNSASSEQPENDRFEAAVNALDEVALPTAFKKMLGLYLK